MSTELAKMGQLAKSLQQSVQSAGAESGTFMKFSKHGAWEHGTESVEAEEKSLWAIHPEGFQHGWIGWGDEEHKNMGEKLGEVVVSATEPFPSKSELPPIDGRWAQQVSMQMICLAGLDKGVKVLFNTNSVGGRKLYTKIVSAVVEKITAGDDDVAPVVTLEADSYKHKEYGKIFTPLMDIKNWKTVDELTALLAESGDDDDPAEQIEDKKVEPEPEPKPEPEPEGRKRRTRRSR